MSTAVVVNENFSPTSQQDDVLGVIKEEHRVNPLRVRNVTGIDKQRVNDALGSLVDAGWVRHVNQGLYEYVEDPRQRS